MEKSERWIQFIGTKSCSSSNVQQKLPIDHPAQHTTPNQTQYQNKLFDKFFMAATHKCITRY